VVRDRGIPVARIRGNPVTAYVFPGDFCCCEEVAIFRPGQPSVADSLAVLAGQVSASSLVDTLVDQDAHLEVRHARAVGVSLLRVRREQLRARP
jgi:hypothetical protein